MKIGVFCSANNNIDSDFFECTKELGKWIGENNYTVVYGGCNIGLMECIGKSVHEAGGTTIGVVPRIIEKGGKKSNYMDIEFPCENLSDRKDLLMMQSDITVALPGGIGTIDEIFTVAASCSIGYHDKKVILYNVKGFWNKLIMVLDNLQEQGFIRGDYHRYIDVANNFDELTKKIMQG